MNFNVKEVIEFTIEDKGVKVIPVNDPALGVNVNPVVSEATAYPDESVI